MDQYDYEDEAHGERQYVKPDRGAMILVFGILGLLVCFLFGIAAWIMGNEDLKEIRAGRMDRAGEGTTNAGRILGMISVILAVVGIVIMILVLVTGGVAASVNT